MTSRGRGEGRSAPAGVSGPPPRSGGGGGSLVALRDRLSGVIEPVTEQAGFDLERVIVSRVGRRHRVQVVVDSDDGVGLDDIAEVSRAVSSALDAAEGTGAAVVPGEYVLEVSSPGVDRPLTEPRHWRRNVGRLVAVGVAGDGQLTGRVRAADTAGVTLETEPGTTRQLAYDQLGTGRVQVELRRVEDTDDDDDGDQASGEEGA